MKNTIYILFVLLLAASCNKNKEGEFIEKSISGHLFYVDSSSGIYDKTVLPNTMVYLSDSPSFENYIISVKSDSNGYFIFTHTPKKDDNSNLYIFSKAEMNSKLFEKITAANDAENILVLEPDKSSKLSVLVRDSFETAVNGLKTFLYVNYSIAFADSLASGSGSISNGTTNNNGLVSFTGLNSRTYFIRINDSINGVKFKIFTPFSFVVGSKTDTTLVIH